MIGLFALALIQSAQVAETIQSEPEIVVIARKLKDWRGNWKLNKGKPTCKTKRSTGDKAIDAIGCEALITCLAPHAAEMDAIANSKDDRDLKNKRLMELLRPVWSCVSSERQKGIASLADRRAAEAAR